MTDPALVIRPHRDAAKAARLAGAGGDGTAASGEALVRNEEEV
jgi:hypothetical protein